MQGYQQSEAQVVVVEEVNSLEGVEVAAKTSIVDPVLAKLFIVQHNSHPIVLQELHCCHQVVLLQVRLAALHQHRAYRAQPYVLVAVLCLCIVEVVGLVFSYIVAKPQVDKSAWEVSRCA